MTSAFAAAYTVALGRPFPRHLPIGVVGTPSEQVLAKFDVRAHEFDLRAYPSREEAVAAVDRQQIPAVIDATATPPQLLVARANDPSTARALTQLDQTSPGVYELQLVDLRPLPPSDPAGLATFYLVIAATILGFISMFQLRANVKTLTLRRWSASVAALAVVGGAALTGGAVSASLLPQPFAFFNHALPSGATVSAIHSAVYFPDHQRVLPFVVLGGWLAVSLTALVVGSRKLGRSPANR